MNTLIYDLRYGLRMLLKNPGFTFAALITLALGIASSTAIFSVIDGVLLHPLPYPDSEKIMSLTPTMRSTGAPGGASAPANYIDWAAQNDVFSHMAAARGEQFNLTDGDRPERVRGTMTTSNLFPLFGVSPILGRTLLPSDEQPGHNHVVVLSSELWARRYASDRGIIGREISLNDEPHTVVGVMPPNFVPDGYGELWVPSAFGVPTNSIRPNVDPRPVRGSNYLDVFGRLKPGVTLEKARAEMDAISRRLENQYPTDNRDIGVRVTPLHEEVVGGIRPVLLLLFAAVGFLLFIGCANVANLLLARAATRSREISIRAAMGASRYRLIRQLLTESVLLALIGGVLGAVLAAWAIPLLMAMAPPGLQQFQGDRAQRPGARLQSRSLRHHRPPLRARPGHFLFVREPGGVVETGRARQHWRRQPAARLSHRDRSRFVPHPADRRGPDDQELREPDEGRSRIQSQSPPHI